jgi:hypothetical protein
MDAAGHSPRVGSTRREAVGMLESVVGFLLKVAFWAFLAGIAFGIYLAVKYAPQMHAMDSGAPCVVPASAPPVAGLGPSG